jgi:hypothetical protein
MYLRSIRWSPDGSFLATVYGFNNTSHVAPILYRGAWGSSYCDFVGHKKPVVCAVRSISWFLNPSPSALID